MRATMRATILLVTILNLVSPPTINGMGYETDPINGHDLIIHPPDNVERALQILCENPSRHIKAAVECLKEDGKWVVKDGKYAAVIFANITSTAGTKVFELTRWLGGKTAQFKVREKETVKAAIKVADGEIDEKERSNALLLAGWNIGPKVYEIPVHDNTVPFEEYLILERIDGWTLYELFRLWGAKIKSPRARTDKDFALTLERKFLNMLIAYLEGVIRVWDKKHRHCDAHIGNAMMRAAPMEECKRMQEKQGEGESAEFDVIDEGDGEKCVIWDKKYLVLVDPPNMVTLKGAIRRKGCGTGAETGNPIEVDLFRVFALWRHYQGKLQKCFPDGKIADKIESIIKTVPQTMPPLEEEERGREILKGLNDLRREYDSHAETLQLKKWSFKYYKRLNALQSLKKVRSDHTRRTVSTRSHSLK